MCVCWSLTVLTKHAHVHLHKFQISFKSMTEQRKPTLPLWCRKSIFIIFHWLAVYVLSNLQTRSKSVSVHSSVQENSWPAATAYLFVCVCFKCHGVRPWHTRCWQWSSVFGSLYLAEEPPDMVRVMCTMLVVDHSQTEIVPRHRTQEHNVLNWIEEQTGQDAYQSKPEEG